MSTAHEAKRKAILDGAAEVFLRSGFDAGTTKEVAAEVGLSQPAIYHYVGSKADLLREISSEVGRDMMAALDAGLASGDSAAEQLRGIIRAYTLAVVHNLRSFAVFWLELRSLEPDVRATLREDEREFVRRVARLVATLQRQGHLPDGPPTAVAQAIMSMPSWMYHWYRPDGPLNSEQVAELYCALIGLPKD